MRRMRSLLLIGLALAVLGAAAEAQKGGKKPQARVVLGTTQLAGDNGKLGQAYTMGFDLPYKINLTLRSAKYTTTPLVMGERVVEPERDQKLLVLEITVHNPNKTEWLFRGDSFLFTAVDDQDTNHNGVGVYSRSGVTTEMFNARLKPAQKVDLVTCIAVPAKGVMPKLMVAYTTSKKVLRYDLRSIVKPLEAPFADPSDASGATALATIPGQRGTMYPCTRFEIRFDGAALADSVGRFKAEKGKRFAVVTFSSRNIGNAPWLLRGDTYRYTVVNADGDKFSRTTRVLNATSDNDFGRQLDPGEVVTARAIVEVPANVALSKLILTQEGKHDYSFDISDVK